MSFKPLKRVLNSFQKQEVWQEQQQFQCLLRSWAEVVGSLVNTQTRPVAISSRRVLRVATSSSVWAQNLAFERHRILEKLNARLIKPLVDIQFSTRDWQSRPSRRQSIGAEESRHTHPSQVSNSISRPEIMNSQDSHAAFQGWVRAIQSRSHQLALCPKCQCPTPPGELQRWSVCAICAARQWK